MRTCTCTENIAWPHLSNMSRSSSSSIQEDLPDLRLGEELSDVFQHVLQVLVLLGLLQASPVTENELCSADEKRDGWTRTERRKATTRSEEKEGRSSSTEDEGRKVAHKGIPRRTVREAEASLRDLSDL